MKFGDIQESVWNRLMRNSNIADDLSQDEDKNFGGDRHFIQRYVRSSATLNRKLIDGEELDDYVKPVHDAIHRNKHPLSRDVKLYSGTGHDFGEMARKSKDGVIHSPAHISTSHDFSVARGFADDVRSPNSSDSHIVVVHAKAGDKALALAGRMNGDEHETIIPSGTKLKYQGTKTKEEYQVLRAASGMGKPRGEHNNKRVNYHFHHFTIHSQE